LRPRQQPIFKRIDFVFNFIQDGKITVDDQIHEGIEKKVAPSVESIGESLMDMEIFYQAGQRAVMDGDDPVAAGISVCSTELTTRP